MVSEIKTENLATGILDFQKILYKMIRAGKADEFLPCQILFICQLQLAGDKFPTNREKFIKRFGKMAPCRSAMKAMSKRWALYVKNWATYIDFH